MRSNSSLPFAFLFLSHSEMKVLGARVKMEMARMRMMIRTRRMMKDLRRVASTSCLAIR